MRIAFLGIRGIPANYGGFETFVEEVATRLITSKHEVIVYCRTSDYPISRTRQYKGVQLIHLPSIRTKYFDTVSHSLVSTLDLLRRRVDVAYYCNNANAFCVWLPKLVGAKVILNTDGLEWERSKWNTLARTFYRISAHLACHLPDLLVSDSRAIQDYYLRKHCKDSVFVPYGGYCCERGFGEQHLKDFGVEREGYVLWVSRFVPENNPHLVVEAFEQVKTDMKLLVVGDGPFESEYVEKMKRTRDQRIVFPGSVYGERYKALHANAYCYVNSNEVGGTHMTVLDGMGAGGCVLASDIIYNQEALDGTGLCFRNRDVNDLRSKLQHLIDHPELARSFGREAQARISNVYDWDLIAADTMKLCEAVTGARGLMNVAASREAGTDW